MVSGTILHKFIGVLLRSSNYDDIFVNLPMIFNHLSEWHTYSHAI